MFRSGSFIFSICRMGTKPLLSQEAATHEQIPQGNSRLVKPLEPPRDPSTAKCYYSLVKSAPVGRAAFLASSGPGNSAGPPAPSLRVTQTVAPSSLGPETIKGGRGWKEDDSPSVFSQVTGPGCVYLVTLSFWATLEGSWAGAGGTDHPR